MLFQEPELGAFQISPGQIHSDRPSLGQKPIWNARTTNSVAPDQQAAGLHKEPPGDDQASQLSREADQKGAGLSPAESVLVPAPSHPRHAGCYDSAS